MVKVTQTFLQCIIWVQAIKNWTVGRPGNKATFPDCKKNGLIQLNFQARRQPIIRIHPVINS